MSMSYCVEAQGQTHYMLEGLCLSADLGYIQVISQNKRQSVPMEKDTGPDLPQPLSPGEAERNCIVISLTESCFGMSR